MNLYPTNLNYYPDSYYMDSWQRYMPLANPYYTSSFNMSPSVMYTSSFPSYEQWARNIETGTTGLTKEQADYILKEKALQEAQIQSQQQAQQATAKNMEQLANASGSSGSMYHMTKAFEKHNMYKLVTSNEFVSAAKEYSPVAKRLGSVKTYDDFRFAYNNAEGIQKGLIKRAGTNARISKLLEEAQKRAADANMLLETRLDNIAKIKPEHIEAFKGIPKLKVKNTHKYANAAKNAGKYAKIKVCIKNAGTTVQNGAIHTQNTVAKGIHKVRFGWFKGSFGKWFGRTAIVAAIATDGYDVYKTADKHGWASKETIKNVSGKAAGWAGAWTGGKIGAAIGAKVGAGIGAWFGGVGAAPGAAIGALVGGLIGSVSGYFCAEKATHAVVDATTQAKTQVA